MTRKYVAFIALASTLVLIGSGAVSTKMLMTSRIEARIKSELPKASGVSASIPLADIPQNLFSGTIRVVSFIRLFLSHALYHPASIRPDL